jgi:peptidoglycan-associated lipoprotein
MSKRWLRLVVLLVAIIGVGCSSKKPPAPTDTIQSGNLAEEGLASGGSLAQYKQGTLGAEGASSPLQDVRFAYDSEELDETARATLQENGGWLKDHPSAKVEIEGHCDERGTVEYNLALGAKRARSARDYLVALGVAAGRLNTISYGEELPLCYEHEDSCWQRNRRVHFVVLGE